ncbi:hypothetical protein C1646_766627, partial [Rhizophagus diaphanus]
PSLLGGIPPYTGQEPSVKYIDTVIQSWAFAEGHMTALENANAGDFDNAVKCTLLKSKMDGKYAPVPANNGLVAGNSAINTPDTLWVWLRVKYQRKTVGNQQSAFQKLTQEKFQLYDTPDTYETRIRPLLLGVADNDAQVLGFLKSQLSGDLYTWMRIANPAENVVNSNNASIFDSYINQELEKKLGVIKINLAKLTKLVSEDIIDTKSAQYQCSEFSDYNNGGLEKRLEQIKANLAKFAKKDTRGAKTSQPTADEQSNLIFSDDDTFKPEDNDYNSDNSSAGSDFRNRDMNIYIRHGKKKPAEQREYSDKSSKSKVSNKSELRKKEPTTSIVTVKCKIKRLKIPAMALDSCTELPIVTPDIIECVGYGINKSIKHDLSSIATLSIISVEVVKILWL